MKQSPILTVIDALLSHETDNMRWLKQAGPIAKQLNLESKFDLPAKERSE